MTDELVVNEPVAGVNSEPVTETATPEATAEGISESQPNVELRDGKMYVDGKRVYTRDDTNQIAARAKSEVQSQLLQELGVDDLDQVKSVIGTLQEASPNDLSVESLRDTVKKREQTVEELKAELAQLKTETVMKDHIGKLQNEMPGTWNSDQRAAVIDLMKSRGMFELQDTTFAIRHNGELLVDDSGELPDYAAAVRTMGQTLGLPMAKNGVSAVDTDKAPSAQKADGKVDDVKLRDPAYRAAYVALRNSNKNLSRSQITDGMIKKQMEGMGTPGKSGMLFSHGASATPSSQTKSSRRK